MSTATVRGLNINYETVGEEGFWVALITGGRGAFLYQWLVVSCPRRDDVRSASSGCDARPNVALRHGWCLPGNAANREKLMKWGVDQFVSTLTKWKNFLKPVRTYR